MRSSAYHSQGNGFAERNIRSVKDMLRAVLLHRKLQQSQWRSLLPSLVFALNTSESKATKCVPYNVVFGRSAVLPQDISFHHDKVDGYDLVSPKDFELEVTSQLQDFFNYVTAKLEVSKAKMQQQYNTNLRFVDYEPNQKVWLKVKHYKTGENRKLAPRRTGPWNVIRKLPNGVNFRIENSQGEQKVVHHDRLIPVVENGLPNKPASLIELGTSIFASGTMERTAYSASSSASDEFSRSIASASIHSPYRFGILMSLSERLGASLSPTGS